MNFVAVLAAARAREATPLLRRSAFLGWRRRWSRMVAISCARAFATSLTAVNALPHALAGVDGVGPDLADLTVSELRRLLLWKKDEPCLQRLESEVSCPPHVVLPSPEDTVSEVMRLRDLVSQLQAKIGQGPVQDAPCGPIV